MATLRQTNMPPPPTPSGCKMLLVRDVRLVRVPSPHTCQIRPHTLLRTAEQSIDRLPSNLPDGVPDGMLDATPTIETIAKVLLDGEQIFPDQDLLQFRERIV
jgi:hypothetical protein